MTGNYSLTIPQVVEPFSSTILINQTELNFTNIGNANDTMKYVHYLIYLLGDGAMIFGFVQLCRSKLAFLMNGGGNNV